MRRQSSIHIVVIVWVLLLFGCCNAESMDALIKVPRNGYDPKLAEAKHALYDNGYYPEGFNRAELDNFTLDDWTMNALSRLADENPDIPAYDGKNQGMTNRAYWDLTQNPPQVRSIASSRSADAAGSAYREIGWDGVHDGEGSAEVDRVQQRLIELGYLDKDAPNYEPRRLTFGLFDAIKLFLETNHRPDLYDPGLIITIPIQELLFDSPGVIPNPSPKLGPVELLRNYFSGTTPVLGFQMPTLMIWFISIALAVICVFAAIHFFGAEGSAPDRPVSSKKNSGKMVHFDIQYENQHRKWTHAVEPVLAIGRNVGCFPLYAEDGAISRNHCELRFRKDKLIITDNSSNGSYLNGAYFCHAERELHRGDVVKIGDHRITITW